MNSLWAVQWLNAEENRWETCQTLLSDGVGPDSEGTDEVACIFFNKDDALLELKDWEENAGGNGQYRVAEVELNVVWSNK